MLDGLENDNLIKHTHNEENQPYINCIIYNL